MEENNNFENIETIEPPPVETPVAPQPAPVQFARSYFCFLIIGLVIGIIAFIIASILEMSFTSIKYY